ncbi:2-phosphoxylose phosphatase 1 [Halocaridina rubra]|uniref:2-phosphoxylose phosphatase 1 n=1 Tax=Halocaridina rubra TaxID=373956 RepID=A0AAN8XA59_HALRR
MNRSTVGTAYKNKDRIMEHVKIAVPVQSTTTVVFGTHNLTLNLENLIFRVFQWVKNSMRWQKKFRVFRCHIFILGWLGVLLLLMTYLRLETDSAHPPPPLMVNRGAQTSPNVGVPDKPRNKKMRQQCNPPDRIQRHQEGVLPAQYELNGVIVALRHGDRGPLVHVSNLSSINCGHKSYGTPAYRKYVSDILNASKTNAYINFVGPFMKYPLLPLPTKCSIGHLTPQGVSQHLQLGKVLKEVYLNEWNLLGSKRELDDIVVHSTKYRRTFQSLLAFLYSFLPGFDISAVRIQDGKGISFCDNDCRCEKIDFFDQKYEQERRDYRKSHPGVVELVRKINPLVKANPLSDDITNPLVMRDALLAYVCHGAPLPCSESKCVKIEDVTGLISYEDWEGKQKRTSAQRKSAKLRSYGLLKSIIAYIDGMVADSKPRVVIYSGHDKTLKFLLDSLAITNYQLPYYASRLIIEVYRNTTSPQNPEYGKNYFFRLVYNGKDITRFIPFCDSVMIKQLKTGSVKRGSINLCSVSSQNIESNPRKTLWKTTTHPHTPPIQHSLPEMYVREPGIGSGPP